MESMSAFIYLSSIYTCPMYIIEKNSAATARSMITPKQNLTQCRKRKIGRQNDERGGR